MKYNVYKPADVLKNIVEQYFVITSTYDLESLVFLPNGGNFLIFNRDNPYHTQLSSDQTYKIPEGFSVSLKRNKTKKIIFKTTADLNSFSFPIILVELTPIGFYKLFNQDAFILTQNYLSISDKLIERYFLKLYTHNNIEDELSYLNNSLLEMETANNNGRLLVEDIIDSIIYKHHFEVTVEELMREFKSTRKTMERQFKKTVGLTPKNFIYILKFCKTFLQYVQDMKPLKDIEYLYSDNAHFNAVFHNITGYAPNEFYNAVHKGEIRVYQMNHYE